jgi:porphobilinogen deaminase
MTAPLLRLGTRGSPLALTQTGLVRDALAKARSRARGARRHRDRG